MRWLRFTTPKSKGFGQQLETLQSRLDTETHEANKYNVANIISAYRELTAY